MSGKSYLCPTLLLSTNPPAAPWHATTASEDAPQSLVVVLWDNPNLEAEWDSRPEVLPLGEPWEAIPAEAAALLASLQPVEKKAGEGVTAIAAPNSVASALRKLSWPGARLAR